MNEYEQERSQNLQKKSDQPTIDDADMKMDRSNDNTPVRYSDHITDNDKIEIDLSAGLEKVKDQQNSPGGGLETQPPIKTNVDDLETEENVLDIGTDRRFNKDAQGGSNDLPELNEQSKKDDFFPRAKESPLDNPSCSSRCCFKIRKSVLMLGALFSFLNCAGDIVYTTKAPFYEHMMWAALIFLSLRYVIFIIMACQHIRTTTKCQTEELSYEKATLMRAIVNFFSDLGGMPLLMTFGMYRIFPARDFSREICFGYVAELTTSLIPMLVIQIMNNELHVGEFSWLQMSCMILRFLSLFTLSMEILILTFEYRYNSKMRGAGFRTFHPRQGEERSKAYSERMAKVTFISILGMLSLLVGGLVLTEGRSCYGDGSVLHWGVCTACEDRMCADCWQGPEICSTCLIGYREDKVTGKCVDCDGDPELTKCERCHIGPFGGNECLQCAKGYHLDPRHNQCLACSELTGVAHCASCDSKKGTCDTCREGYYFREVDGKKHCAKCSDKFEFCDTCNEKQCTSCYDHIATFDKNGHCRSCTAPWLSSQSQWPHCKCPFIVDAAGGYYCKECNQLIPGCNKCEYSTNAYDHQLSIYVGWDAILSAKDNNYISADRKKQPRWITCTEADNRTMVNVMVGKELNSAQKSDGINAVVSPGLDVDVQSNLPLLAQETAVRSCDTLIPGCAECNQGNDQVVCKVCKPGHFWSRHREYSNTYGVTLVHQCLSCKLNFSNQCEECTDTGCTQCAQGFAKFSWSKSCHLCPKNLSWLCKQ